MRPQPQRAVDSIEQRGEQRTTHPTTPVGGMHRELGSTTLDALVQAAVTGQCAHIVRQQVYEAGTGMAQAQHRRFRDGLHAIRGRRGGQHSHYSGDLSVVPNLRRFERLDRGAGKAAVGK